MPDRFAALPHLLRMLIEPALNGFENVLMLSACDSSLFRGGTAMFDGAALADVGQIAAQHQSPRRGGAFAPQRISNMVG
jgi:hypothetical protein